MIGPAGAEWWVPREEAGGTADRTHTSPSELISKAMVVLPYRAPLPVFLERPKDTRSPMPIMSRKPPSASLQFLLLMNWKDAGGRGGCPCLSPHPHPTPVACLEISLSLYFCPTSTPYMFWIVS